MTYSIEHPILQPCIVRKKKKKRKEKRATLLYKRIFCSYNQMNLFKFKIEKFNRIIKKKKSKKQFS